jgi:hypothetical protein
MNINICKYTYIYISIYIYIYMKGSIAENEKNIAVLGLKNFWGEGMYTCMCMYS